jgi:hypothetical protein
MCLRPNGIHALSAVDRDHSDRAALLLDQVRASVIGCPPAVRRGWRGSARSRSRACRTR